MGAVYEATQLSLNRVVALKLLAPNLSDDPGFRARFEREGQVQAGLDHDHIVSVYEAGQSDYGLFLAMRLIAGPTLKQLILDGDLDPRRSVRLLAQVAQALDSAHDAGLIHRDIKPQNILIGRGDHAYLADFGLIKAPDEARLTGTGQFIGTIDYVAPEQVQGEPATPASDCYALTGVLYECLTGEVPFPKPSEAATLHAHVMSAPPTVSERRPDLPSRARRRRHPGDGQGSMVAAVARRGAGRSRPRARCPRARRRLPCRPGPPMARTGRRAPAAGPDDQGPAAWGRRARVSPASVEAAAGADSRAEARSDQTRTRVGNPSGGSSRSRADSGGRRGPAGYAGDAGRRPVRPARRRAPGRAAWSRAPGELPTRLVALIASLVVVAFARRVRRRPGGALMPSSRPSPVGRDSWRFWCEDQPLSRAGSTEPTAYECLARFRQPVIDCGGGPVYTARG